MDLFITVLYISDSCCNIRLGPWRSSHGCPLQSNISYIWKTETIQFSSVLANNFVSYGVVVCAGNCL